MDIRTRVLQFWRALSKSTDAIFFIKLYTFTYLILFLLGYINTTLIIQKRNAIRAENQNRVARANTVLSNMNPIFDTNGYFITSHKSKQGKLKYSTDHPCSIAISVVSVSRDKDMRESDKPHYLTQVVAAFTDVIQQSDVDDMPIHFSVCNVDNQPARHFDVKNLPNWITVFERRQNSGKTNESMFVKEGMDYIFCLQKTLELNTTFILLLEDDALPHSDLFTVLKEDIFSKIKCTVKQRNEEDILYIKLHANDRDIGFIRTWRGTGFMYLFGVDVEKLFELFGMSLILSGLAFLSYKKYFLKSRVSSKLLFLIFFIYMTCSLNIIGRKTIRIIWRYLLGITHEISTAPAGSFVAVLYPRSSAESSIMYLRSTNLKKSFPKDVALHALARENWKKVLYIEPNLFTHIGYMTTRGYTRSWW